MTGGLRVAAIQHDIVWNDRDANFARLAPVIAAAAGSGAGLVLCTETFSTGFVVDGDLVGEPEGGPSSVFLSDQARANGVWVGGSCAEIPADGGDDSRPFNSFVPAGPDGTVHRYRKVHPFTHAGEEKHFRAGTELVTVDIDGLRCTPLVCYDLRFADEFWQTATDTRIVDPLGELLATAALGETTLLADLSAERVADTREHFRFMQDRRTG